MEESKILVPAYKRTGSCKGCGADIYTPDLKQGGDWPSMSACVCERRSGAVRRERVKDSGNRREAELEKSAQAA